MKHIHVHEIITQKHLSAHKWKENIHRNLFASRCNLQDYINSVEANNRSINKPTHFIINSTLRGRINLKKGSWGDEGIKKGACFFISGKGGGSNIIKQFIKIAFYSKKSKEQCKYERKTLKFICFA